MVNNHKKGVMVGVIAAICLVLVFGVTFAIWNYSRTTENQILVTGDIFMKYTGTNQIDAKNMLPIDINTYYGGYTLNQNMTSEELSSCENYFNELNEKTMNEMMFQEGETAKAFCEGTGKFAGQVTFQQALDNNLFYDSPIDLEELKMLNTIKQDTSKIKEKIPYFEFKIEGVNDYSKDIWYEIVLKDGEEPEGRTERIRDDLLRFRLVEVVGGEEEKEIFTDRGYEDISNERIYVNTINANTKEKITRTYRIYMWISDSVKVGVGEGIDYDMETWNNEVYASVKINVAGDFNEKEVNYTQPVQPARCFKTQEFDNNGKTEIMITDYDKSCGRDVIIPSKINGHEVTVIGSSWKDNNEDYIQPMAFSEDEYEMSFRNKGLTSVVIPNTVRTIGEKAFAYNNLIKVELPDSVEWVDDNVFVNNYSFKEIIIGNGIKYIGYNVFASGCSAGKVNRIQIKKTCEEIKNIPSSPTGLERKNYPFMSNTADSKGLDIYGYEDGAYKLCEHFNRNDFY